MICTWYRTSRLRLCQIPYAAGVLRRTKKTVLWPLDVSRFLTAFRENKFIPESVQKSPQGAWEYSSPIITPDHFGAKSEKRQTNNNNNSPLLNIPLLKLYWPSVAGPYCVRNLAICTWYCTSTLRLWQCMR